MGFFSMKIDDDEIGKLIKITKVDRGLTPEIEDFTKSYDRRNGESYIWSKYKSREIEVEFTIAGDVDSKKTTLTKILTKNNMFKVIFGDESDRYYIAKLTNSSSFEKVNNQFATGSFTLKCFEPFSFSVNEKLAVNSPSSLIFNNEGTAPTHPIFTFNLLSDLSMLALTSPDGRVIQYGYDPGQMILKSGDVVIIDTDKCIITVNGVRKYITPASRWFSVGNGLTEIGVTVNLHGTTPKFKATFREVYL